MLRIAIALCGLAIAAPSFATEWVICSDTAGEASMGYLAGDGLGVLQVVGLTITAGDRNWSSSTAYGPGDPVAVGQGFEDDLTVRLDVVDADFSKIAELRLVKATEGDDYVSAGTLRIVGVGAWPVICEGP